MEEHNDRRDLYEEFESEVVKRGNTEAFFDENDLVEIFDYASDFNNYIVKMEVLLYGAVHYPKSEALATRRAWMYYSLGDSEATEELNKRVTQKGILNRLLSLRGKFDDASLTDDDETTLKKELDDIVDSTDDFEDEEIIQLTDFAYEVGLGSWLSDNKEKIQSKCSYPQTFLYELADRYDEADEYESASQLFEELTMLEPFTLDFWLRLGATQINLEDYEGAVSSAEYALAIDPESVMALRIKGAAIYRMGRGPEAVTEIYRKVYDSGQVIDSDIATLSASLVESGKSDEAIRILKEYFKANPASRVALDVILVIDTDEARPYLENYFETNFPVEEEVIAWAKGHVTHGQFLSAAILLEIYDKHRLISPVNIGFMAEVYYFAERFKDVVNLYETKIDEASGSRLLPAPALPYVMSLARLGDRKKAIKTGESILEKLMALDRDSNIVQMMNFFDTTPSTTRALFAGYLGIVRATVEALKEDVDPDVLDPMIH